MTWGYVGAAAITVAGNKLLNDGGSAPQYNAQSDLETQARLNRVNTTSPFGGTTWSEDPNTGKWTQANTFSPELQNLFNRQIQGAGFDYSPEKLAAPTLGQFQPGNYQDLVDAATQATFQKQKALLDPYYEQQNRTFEQTMANRGLPVGAEAYDTSYANMTDAQNRAYQQAAMDAILAGQQEQGRLYGQDLSTYGTNTQTALSQYDAQRAAESDYFNKLLQGKQLDYNQLASLLQQNQAQPVSPLNVSGALGQQYQGQLLNYQQQQQQNNNMWNSLGNMGAMYAYQKGQKQ